MGAGCEALVTLLSHPVSRAVLEACPRLKLVANAAVGFDNVSLDLMMWLPGQSVADWHASLDGLVQSRQRLGAKEGRCEELVGRWVICLQQREHLVGLPRRIDLTRDRLKRIFVLLPIRFGDFQLAGFHGGALLTAKHTSKSFVPKSRKTSRECGQRVYVEIRTPGY